MLPGFIRVRAAALPACARPARASVICSFSTHGDRSPVAAVRSQRLCRRPGRALLIEPPCGPERATGARPPPRTADAPPRFGLHGRELRLGYGTDRLRNRPVQAAAEASARCREEGCSFKSHAALGRRPAWALGVETALRQSPLSSRASRARWDTGWLAQSRSEGLWGPTASAVELLGGAGKRYPALQKGRGFVWYREAPQTALGRSRADKDNDKIRTKVASGVRIFSWSRHRRLWADQEPARLRLRRLLAACCCCGGGCGGCCCLLLLWRRLRRRLLLAAAACCSLLLLLLLPVIT